MRLLAHLLMKLFVLIVQSSVSYLFEMTIALNPLFRRQWSSVYEALQDCRPDREKLMQLYIQQMSEVERERISDRSYGMVKTPCAYPQRTHL